MHILNKVKLALAMVLAVGSLAAPAFASARTVSAVGNTAPVKLVLEGQQYLEGKVNDPVTRKTQKAYIIPDNASFHLETNSSSIVSSDIIVYSNEFVEGQDKGVRNRILSKTVPINETTRLLPDSYYEDGENDGSLYDFTNRCFDVRIYMNSEHTQYQDVYFNIVDEDMFSEMQSQAKQKKEEAAIREKQLIQQYGPAAAEKS